jgi:hypothetical protein
MAAGETDEPSSPTPGTHVKDAIPLDDRVTYFFPA